MDEDKIDFKAIKQMGKDLYTYVKNSFNKDRYKIVWGYRFDRFLFQIILVLSLGYLFYLAYSANFQLNYFECYPAKDGLCKNPFYKPITWENSEYLPAGKYGTEPFGILTKARFYPVLFILTGLVINHFIHNRRFFKNETN